MLMQKFLKMVYCWLIKTSFKILNSGVTKEKYCIIFHIKIHFWRYKMADQTSEIEYKSGYIIVFSEIQDNEKHIFNGAILSVNEEKSTLQVKRQNGIVHTITQDQVIKRIFNYILYECKFCKQRFDFVIARKQDNSPSNDKDYKYYCPICNNHFFNIY